VKSSIQLIEQMIRSLTAMHFKLIHHRSAGKTSIGGTPIDELIAEIDAGISNRERMLACFKAEVAGTPEPSELTEIPSELHASAVSAEANEVGPSKLA
jgi:hypothetical protein